VRNVPYAPAELPAGFGHRLAHSPVSVAKAAQLRARIAFATPPAPLHVAFASLEISAEHQLVLARESMTEIEHPRSIRSFVTRAGRITEAQQRALEVLWPKYGLAYEPHLLDLDAIFGRRTHRALEIGFGNGENLAATATAHPDRDYIGIEVHRAGVGRLLLAVEELRLPNVRVICHDAVEVLERQIPSQSLDELLILFPDPWPKKRHHKRRLIQAPFVQLATERLKSGGLIRLATDWQPYAQEMLVTLSAHPQLRNLAADGTFIPRPAGRIATRFEKRGERLGHEVWDLAFSRA
jgi:tRNA (guanine-N7-)-methyltransferase